METAIVSVQLHSSEDSSATPGSIASFVAPQRLRAIVGRKHYQRIVSNLQLRQLFQQPPHRQIDVMHIRKVLSLSVFNRHRFVLLNKFRRRSDWLMRFMKCQIHKEWLLRMIGRLLTQPCGRFIHHHVTTEVVCFTNWLTIAAVVLSVLLGSTALMASIVFSIQRIFEAQLG